MRLGSWLQIKSQAPDDPAGRVSAARSLFAALRKAHNPVELRPVTLFHSVGFWCPKLSKCFWNHILANMPARVVVGCALSRDHYLGCYPEPSGKALFFSTLSHLSPDNHLMKLDTWYIPQFEINHHMKLSHTIIWQQLSLDTSRPKKGKNGSNIQEHEVKSVGII